MEIIWRLKIVLYSSLFEVLYGFLIDYHYYLSLYNQLEEMTVCFRFNLAEFTTKGVWNFLFMCEDGKVYPSNR